MNLTSSLTSSPTHTLTSTKDIPSWVPEGALGRYDFANNRYWQAPYSFARASVALAENLAGVYSSYAIDVPRINDKGILIEHAATQEGVTAISAFTLTGLSIAAFGGSVPFGSGFTLTEDSATSWHSASQAITGAVSSVEFALSVMIKPIGVRDWCILRMNEVSVGGNAIQAYYDISSGTVGTASAFGVGAVSGATMEELANGFYRVSLRGIVGASPSNGIVVRFGGANGDGGVNYTGNGGDEYIVSHYQLELGDTTSPIAIAGAPRSADVPTLNLGSVTQNLTVTFDDDSTQEITGVSGDYEIDPTALDRPNNKYIDRYAA